MSRCPCMLQDFSKTSAWTISKIEAIQAIRVFHYPCVAHCVHHMQQALLAKQAPD